jgi:hypothetical protein
MTAAERIALRLDEAERIQHLLREAGAGHALRPLAARIAALRTCLGDCADTEEEAAPAEEPPAPPETDIGRHLAQPLCQPAAPVRRRTSRVWTPEMRAAQRARMLAQLAAGTIKGGPKRKAAAAEAPGPEPQPTPEPEPQPVPETTMAPVPTRRLPACLAGLDPEELQEARDMMSRGRRGARDLASYFGWSLIAAQEIAEALRAEQASPQEAA